MAQKTYLVGLWLVLSAAYRYSSRWQPKLQASMTEQQFACLTAVITALGECLPLIAPGPPNP